MLVFFHKPAWRWLPAAVFVAGVLGLAWILPGAAQQDMTIRDATLQLWPEFDDPGLLVIYSGDFTDTVTFPKNIAFPLPGNARGTQATSRESNGRLINQQWQVVSGKLTYTLPGPGFHIEYYLDRPPSGDQREISYTFEIPYTTDSLDVRVQQPARATDFSLTPPPDGSVVGDDGLTYFILHRTNLKAGDKLDFTIRYKKPDQGLSSAPIVTAQTVSAPQVETAQKPLPKASSNSWLPWVLIAVGLLALAAAAVYWFSQDRHFTTAPAEKGAHPISTSSSAVPSQTSSKSVAFCTQCGRQFRPEDRFCANCGAPR